MEDLQWTIPEKVSNVQVDETSIEGETTPQQTTQGESNDPSEPVPTWFWSITEKFKQGIHQRVTYCQTPKAFLDAQINPCKYIRNKPCFM